MNYNGTRLRAKLDTSLRLALRAGVTARVHPHRGNLDRLVLPTFQTEAPLVPYLPAFIPEARA